MGYERGRRPNWKIRTGRQRLPLQKTGSVDALLWKGCDRCGTAQPTSAGKRVLQSLPRHAVLWCSTGCRGVPSAVQASAEGRTGPDLGPSGPVTVPVATPTRRKWHANHQVRSTERQGGQPTRLFFPCVGRAIPPPTISVRRLICNPRNRACTKPAKPCRRLAKVNCVMPALKVARDSWTTLNHRH